MRIGRSIIGPSPFSKCSPTSIGISGSRMSAKMIAASTLSRSTAVTVTSADNSGASAHLEKIVLLANAPILRHVAARLAHQPNRRVRQSPRGGTPSSSDDRRAEIASRLNSARAAELATRSLRRDPRCARLAIRINVACAAASLTRCPSFECSGSKSTLSPYARICSEQTGPIEPTAIRANPRLTLVADSLGLGELDDVGDLVRAGENRDVRLARRNRVQRGTQRCAVGRQRPSIDRNNRYARAARFESRRSVRDWRLRIPGLRRACP